MHNIGIRFGVRALRTQGTERRTKGRGAPPPLPVQLCHRSCDSCPVADPLCTQAGLGHTQVTAVVSSYKALYKELICQLAPIS